MKSDETEHLRGISFDDYIVTHDEEGNDVYYVVLAWLQHNGKQYVFLVEEEAALSEDDETEVGGDVYESTWNEGETKFELFAIEDEGLEKELVCIYESYAEEKGTGSFPYTINVLDA